MPNPPRQPIDHQLPHLAHRHPPPLIQFRGIQTNFRTPGYLGLDVLARSRGRTDRIEQEDTPTELTA